MYTLHTVLFIFLRRWQGEFVRLSRAPLLGDHFLFFLRPLCLIHQWYCEENFDASHLKSLEGRIFWSYFGTLFFYSCTFDLNVVFILWACRNCYNLERELQEHFFSWSFISKFSLLGFKSVLGPVPPRYSLNVPPLKVLLDCCSISLVSL